MEFSIFRRSKEGMFHIGKDVTSIRNVASDIAGMYRGCPLVCLQRASHVETLLLKVVSDRSAALILIDIAEI
jgi:hypothetical protein